MQLIKLEEKLSNMSAMDSLQIAELTDKLHSDVMLDIRKILETIEEDITHFCVDYIDENGDKRKMYQLDKRLTSYIITKYYIKLKIINENKLSIMG